MLAALLGWPQATFASKIVIEGEGAHVTREVDGGLETLKIKLPAIITTDLAPQRAALSVAAQHHEGQEEAARCEEAGRPRRRSGAAPQGRQDGRAGGPQRPA
jgi:electron transfer flavoprotein alpha/beta subunit